MSKHPAFERPNTLPSVDCTRSLASLLPQQVAAGVGSNLSKCKRLHSHRPQLPTRLSSGGRNDFILPLLAETTQQHSVFRLLHAGGHAAKPL
ncbi:hypothetical protein WJX74_008131 [Apatococcus lobatus]|uniref:Uncharacterized protein n=1 Tax=Apatococcus lobatus TaxID=904363 RepID=A0AAW1SH75_9CHLO